MINSILHSLGKGAVEDSRSQKVSICGFELEGVSIAGQETCIIVPRFKVAFDSGRCPQRSVFQQTLLISHGHLDHVGGVPFHVASRSMLGLPESRVVVPHALEAGVRQLLDAVAVLQDNHESTYLILPLKVGQEVSVCSGIVARPFVTTHGVPSQGYVLYSQRKKLKAEYVGLSSAEIKAIKAELQEKGQELTDTVEVPEIAFTGDTTSDFLSDPSCADALRAKLLIMEMTFIDDAMSVQEAKERGHMHIADFVANAHRFQNEGILLIHFSSRYRRCDIIKQLDTMLPAALRAKVVPFLNGFADSADPDT